MTNRRGKKRQLRRQNQKSQGGDGEESPEGDIGNVAAGAGGNGSTIDKTREELHNEISQAILRGEYGVYEDEDDEDEVLDGESGDIVTLLYHEGMQHVCEYICSFLDTDSLLAIEKVSVECKKIVSEGLLWKKFLERLYNEDNRVQLICIYDGWSEFLFRPKLEILSYQFYKDLYFRVQRNLQTLARNWWGEVGCYINRKIINVTWGTPSPLESDVLCLHLHDDSLVVGLSSGFIRVLRGPNYTHTMTLEQSGEVDCVQCDDSIIITTSPDGKLWIWHSKTGSLIKTLHQHSDKITGIRLSDKWLISCSKDKTVIVWRRIGTTNFIQELTLVDDLLHEFTCVDFNNQYLVAGLDGSHVKIWKVGSWAQYGYLYGHEDSVTCIQIKDAYTVTGSFDGTVRIWYTKFGVCIRVLNHGRLDVTCLRLNDNFLITGYNCLIYVWDYRAALNLNIDASNEGIIHRIDGEGGYIQDLCMDDFKIVSCSADNTISLSEFLLFGELN